MKQIGLALVALLMLTPMANAETMKIAVVDSEMAVLESDSWKKYSQEADKKIEPRIKLIQSLRDELQKMENDLQKNGPTMSQTQVESKQLEMKRKYEDLQMQDRQLRMERGQSDQQELGNIRPKLEQAIEETSKELKYDLTIERGAVRFVAPKHDITRQVIERLNRLK